MMGSNKSVFMANNITTQKLCHWFIQQANENGTPVTPVKLNHLVILASWWYRYKTGEPLIAETPEAWSSGPVLTSIHHEYKDQPAYSVIEYPSRRQPPLEDEEQTIPFLQEIWQLYGKYTGQQLTRINTSAHSPWAQTQEREGSTPRQEIAWEQVEAYFLSLKN